MITSKKRCLRTRRSSDTSESEDENSTIVDDTHSLRDEGNVVEAIRELQRVRKRRMGMSLSALSTGKVAPEEVAIVNDPFKLKTGGLVNMRVIGKSHKTEDEDDVEARLAKTFATETNKRDEDAEMVKYIEEEVAKRKGIRNAPSTENTGESDLLQDVPAHLRPAIGQQKEDMLSNQMLCGIPEIDLGVEAKMRNIEATEDAKQSLIKKRLNNRHSANSLDGLAPTNVAVNFVQHSRWNSYADSTTKSGPPRVSDSVSEVRDGTAVSKVDTKQVDTHRLEAERERLKAERATDTAVLQRFKTYMRDRKRR